MRAKRLLLKNKDGVYHVICRTAYQSDKLTDEGKSVFVSLLKKQARFSGVEVITYCLLNNHIHLLVKIPHMPSIDDKTLIERYRALYGEDGTEYVMPIKRLVKILEEGGKTAEHLRKTLTARMQNLSLFVKELKQRFGIWFNRRYQNSGTLWSERYSSILIENSEAVITAVAAYIEMNPVRVGQCKRPEDYRFSNYKRNPYRTLIEGLNASNALQQKFSGISKGKVVGSQAFVEAYHDKHQSGLKEKSKWLQATAINIASLCIFACEFHLPRKSIY